MKIYKQSSLKNKVDALKEAFGSDDDSEDEAKSEIPGEDAKSEEPDEADMADLMADINKMNKQIVYSSNTQIQYRMYRRYRIDSY